MQDKLTQVEKREAETGLIKCTKKTKVLKANTNNQANLNVNSTALEEVNNFTYLGSVVDNTGGSELDIKTRIGKARTSFRMTGTILTTGTINTKIRLFNSNIKTILLYGCKTWKTTKSLLNKLQAFFNNCLMRIINIRWPDKIKNTDLWEKTKKIPVEQDIKKIALDRVHVKKTNELHHQAGPTMNPQGKRRVGRPRKTWKRNTTHEMEKPGYKSLKTFSDWPKTGQNGGVSLVAYVPLRYKRLKQASKQVLYSVYMHM